jgi:hypothetical protein
MALALTNVATAAQKLHAANAEKGYNKAKLALLEAAEAELATAKTVAGQGNTALTVPQLALVNEAALNIALAKEMGAASREGSGTPVKDQKMKAEYMHTETAYLKTLAALSA